MALRTTMKRVGYDGKLEGKDEDEEEDDDDVIKVSNANGRTMPIVSMMMATTVRTITDIMTMRTAMTPFDDDGDDVDDDHVARTAEYARRRSTQGGGVHIHDYIRKTVAPEAEYASTPF